MPPSDSFTGMQSSKIVTHLTTWATRDGRGVVTDASVGFRLPDGALLAPDAAWTSKTRVLERNAVEAQGFWRLCADFIIELRSHADRLRVAREKMQEWIDNGARRAWLIDPEREAVEI